MTPTHHLPAELILDRANGTLPEALEVLAASHLTLCPECRARESELEAVGGALLAQSAPSPVPDSVRQAVFARIAAEPAAPAPAAGRGDSVIPSPLLGYSGPFASLRWAHRLLGCLRLDLPLAYGGRSVRLLQFPAGFRIPPHRHEAVEYSLVLTGGYSDGGEHFVRGDVAVHPPGLAPHAPVIDADGPCLMLLVHSGRLISQSFLGTLGTWFVDR